MLRSTHENLGSEPDGLTVTSDQAALLRELDNDTRIVAPMSEAEIEAKYDDNQAHLFIQRNDFLIPNILQMMKDKEILNVSPEYQRRNRWDDRKRSHLIESLLINVPIPPVFLYEVELASYEVMDGQQRLSTIGAFFQNEFRLKDLRVWPELNRKYFQDLPIRIQRGLMRRGLAAVIILRESNQSDSNALQLRQYVFERLNTGGEILNAQEVRNCIYASKFNEMLIRIARSPVFTSIWGIPPKETGEPHRVSQKLRRNPLYAKMADCEIVLRYFALSDLENFKGGMKATLDGCMEEMLGASIDRCARLEENYLEVVGLASDIFQDSVFRIPGKTGVLNGRRSITLADAVLIGLTRVKPKYEALRRSREAIVASLTAALNTEAVFDLLVGAGNTRAIFNERFDYMTRLLLDSIA